MDFFSFKQLLNLAASRYLKKTSVCMCEPQAICLYVTDRCTLSCEWCLRQSPSYEASSGRHDMTLEDARKIVGFFPKATHLSIAGFGEPLIVKDVFKIVQELKKRPMRISLITNGTLLLDRMDEVVKARLRQISVSINSIDPIQYGVVSGSSEKTFNTVVQGVQTLAQKRGSDTRLQISFVITRNLLDSVPDIIRFAEDIGVDYLVLHNLISHTDFIDYTGVLTDDDEVVINKFKEWKSKEYKVKVFWPTLVKKGLENPAHICVPMWEWIGIDMEGNTAGCSRAMGASKQYGNIFKEGKDVWNNEFRKALRRSFIKGDTFLYDCCRTCAQVQP